MQNRSLVLRSLPFWITLAYLGLLSAPLAPSSLFELAPEAISELSDEERGTHGLAILFPEHGNVHALSTFLGNLSSNVQTFSGGESVVISGNLKAVQNIYRLGKDLDLPGVKDLGLHQRTMTRVSAENIADLLRGFIVPLPKQRSEEPLPRGKRQAHILVDKESNSLIYASSDQTHRLIEDILGFPKPRS